jgi:hypothetical protein
MDYTPKLKERFAELRPVNGKLQADWNMTDTKLMDAVKIALPPTHVIPIVFVPGIMGTNLCDMRNRPVWLLDNLGGAPAKLAWNWATKDAGVRQRVLHPDRTRVYRAGAVPKNGTVPGLNEQDFLKRGWGEISESSYHKFLLWLDRKMNEERNPANWNDFSNPSLSGSVSLGEKIARKLPGGLVMNMNGLPVFSEGGKPVVPITSDELLVRSKSSFPIHAFGYNWLESNDNAARKLKERIEEIINEYNNHATKCSQVILITHSMGGLVARACYQLHDMSKKVAGIVHGVMPATGAAVAYRRCKVGMRDEDFAAGLVIGSTGQEVTAVFAQAPGALQLLPSEMYGKNWLEIYDPNGKLVKSLPETDPYEEIYLCRDKWWGLIREEWLSPIGGAPISWDKFVKNIRLAKDFHRRISKSYHHNTFVFYGGGNEKTSFSKIQWKMKKGIPPIGKEKAPPADVVPSLNYREIRTDGSNKIYVGGETLHMSSGRSEGGSARTMETSYFEIRCANFDDSGDGTVPKCSGGAPYLSAGKNVIQQFELAGIKHEPAYRDYPIAQQVAYYGITKLAAMADLR